jgi:polar amino acid transport system substrate-binding protein
MTVSLGGKAGVGCILAILAANPTSGSGADPSLPAPLRVAIRQIEPFVVVGQGPPTGFSIDLIEVIARTLGTTIECQLRSSVDDLIQAAASGDADAAIGMLTITATREDPVDFSHTFYRSGLRVAIPTHAGTTWTTTLRRFVSLDFLSVLAAIGSLTLLAAHLLWLLEREANPDCFPATYLPRVGEALWGSVATIITGGCENKAPMKPLGRLVAVAWMLGSTVLVASFTATLASQLTSETVAHVITGPSSLPGRTVAPVKGTTAVSALREMQAHPSEYPSLTEAADVAIRGKADALVYDAPMLGFFLTNSPSVTPTHRTDV